MLVGLLSGQVFSPFGELWLAVSHGGGGICTGRRSPDESWSSGNCCEGWWALGIGGGVASCTPPDALVLLKLVYSVAGRSAHELAHKHADERGAKMRWPWEKLVNTGNDDVDTSLSRSALISLLCSQYKSYTCTGIEVVQRHGATV